jgi:TRAP-type C4-dicarboxylate transport system permease small subunit
MDGRTLSLVGLGSDLGDLVGFCFIAPVFLTALALRGGLLAWPWALLTAGFMGWVGYDIVNTVVRVLAGMNQLPFHLRILAEVFRSFACTFTFIAGISQRLVLRSSAEMEPPKSARGGG